MKMRSNKGMARIEFGGVTRSVNFSNTNIIWIFY